MPATPAIIPADPKLWRAGFLDLRPTVSPCPGLTGPNWTAIHAKGLDFLDRWADQAADLGWTTLDLWGVNPRNGTIRVDYCGAMVIGNAMVTEVTAEHIKWQNATYQRVKAARPEGAVPLWPFGK